MLREHHRMWHFTVLWVVKILKIQKKLVFINWCLVLLSLQSVKSLSEMWSQIADCSLQIFEKSEEVLLFLQKSAPWLSQMGSTCPSAPWLRHGSETRLVFTLNCVVVESRSIMELTMHTPATSRDPRTVQFKKSSFSGRKAFITDQSSIYLSLNLSSSSSLNPFHIHRWK